MTPMVSKEIEIEIENLYAHMRASISHGGHGWGPGGFGDLARAHERDHENAADVGLMHDHERAS